eukprot:Skav228732  [mRNA]  locus=scaffold869:27768:34941:+ [translate_table: standard]
MDDWIWVSRASVCFAGTPRSLGIRVPDREHLCFQALGKRLGPRRLVFVTVALSVIFLVLFFVGLSETVMSLKVAVDENGLVGMVA